MSDVTDRLFQQAAQARREHRLADAKRDLIQAVDLSRKAGTQLALAKALTGLGQIERDLHHGEAALKHYQEAVAIYRAEGDALKLAHTVRHVGDILQDEGRHALAEPCYHEALSIYRSNQPVPPLDLANCIRGLALLKQHIGQTDDARSLWEEARDLYAAVNVEAGVAESQRRIAQLSQR